MFLVFRGKNDVLDMDGCISKCSLDFFGDSNIVKCGIIKKYCYQYNFFGGEDERNPLKYLLGI